MNAEPGSQTTNLESVYRRDILPELRGQFVRVRRANCVPNANLNGFALLYMRSYESCELDDSIAPPEQTTTETNTPVWFDADNRGYSHKVRHQADPIR